MRRVDRLDQGLRSARQERGDEEEDDELLLKQNRRGTYTDVFPLE